MSSTVTVGSQSPADSPDAPTDAPPRGPAPWLRLSRAGHDVDVELFEQLTVGRLGGADIVVDSPIVSRVHALLSRSGDQVLVRDCGSHNGTTLHQKTGPRRLGAGERAVVEPGDVVDVAGAARITVLARGAERRRRDNPTVSVAGQRFATALAAAARTRLPVVLRGASGTGKTHAARQLHDDSGRAGAFVLVNCARLPTDPAALHSELLGHKRGSYTGAVADRVGRWALAHGGTLFLDEVESLSSAGQGFLLDVLDGSGELVPLGGAPKDALRLDVRVVAATKQALGASALRRDLSERLAEGHLLAVPDLADRKDDIPALLSTFLEEQARLLGRPVRLADGVVADFVRADWPGNIRQLRSALQTIVHTAAVSAGAERGAVVVEAAALAAWLQERALVFGAAAGAATPAAPAAGRAIADDAEPGRVGETARLLKREQLVAAMIDANGNQSAAARALGIARNTLLKRLRQFDVPPDTGAPPK